MLRATDTGWTRVGRWIAALALVVGFDTAAAWGRFEHRMVARIAWETMSPSAREQAIRLLASAPADTGFQAHFSKEAAGIADVFVDASTWADEVRVSPTARKYSCPMWHFAEYAIASPGIEIPALPRFQPTQANVVEQLKLLQQMLGNEDEPAEARALALLWVLHLVADIHQPLHVVSRVSAEHPEGDLGGNLVRLSSRANLHSYWDTILGRRDPSPSERDVYGRLVRAHPRQRLLAEISNQQVDRWAAESRELARSVVYAGLTPGAALESAYRDRALSVGERQIALAGYRLAEMLERGLKVSPVGAVQVSAAQEIKSRLDYEFACAEGRLADGMRGLPIVTARFARAPGLGLQKVQGFEPADVRTLIAGARQELIAALAGEDLAAFRHYVEERFPLAVELELIPIAKPEKVTQYGTMQKVSFTLPGVQLAQASTSSIATVDSTNRAFAAVFAFMNSARRNTAAIDLSVLSNPPGATITLQARAGRPMPRETNSTLKTFWRGIYTIVVTKEGFERISLPPQEIGFGTDTIECFLVPVGSQVRACNIK